LQQCPRLEPIVLDAALRLVEDLDRGTEELTARSPDILAPLRISDERVKLVRSLGEFDERSPNLSVERDFP